MSDLDDSIHPAPAPAPEKDETPEEPAAVEEAEQGEVPEPNDKRFCHVCGAELTEDVPFCPACGTRVAD